MSGVKGKTGIYIRTKEMCDNISNGHKGLKHPYLIKYNKEHPKKGRLNGNFGKPASHGKGDYYKGIWMRSSYEIKFSKYLDDNKVKWIYEPTSFDLGYTSYTPDFYLSETNEYIEVKGYWRDDSKLKVELFKQKYPHLKFRILEYKDLIELKILKEV
jgi:predicted nuclease of restriction endonuclease-like RecB superfamily